MVGGHCPVSSSPNSPVPWEELCLGGALSERGCRAVLLQHFNTDNRKEREVRDGHLWAPWPYAVTSRFATHAKTTLRILRVTHVESNLHFTGGRGNSRLDNSHPAHPKIIWALLADSGKLRLIISVYSLSLALSSQHILGFVVIFFFFFLCSHKCKISPLLRADSKLSERVPLIPSLQTTLCFVLQILLQLSRVDVDSQCGPDSVIFLSWSYS